MEKVVLLDELAKVMGQKMAALKIGAAQICELSGQVEMDFWDYVREKFPEVPKNKPAYIARENSIRWTEHKKGAENEG